MFKVMIVLISIFESVCEREFSFGGSQLQPAAVSLCFQFARESVGRRFVTAHVTFQTGERINVGVSIDLSSHK